LIEHTGQVRVTAWPHCDADVTRLDQRQAISTAHA